MSEKTFDRVLVFALFFMAYWFFGNLYEQIVMVPNHLTNPGEVLLAYKGYFQVTGPTLYFVPLTQLAVLAVFVLAWNAKERAQKELLQRASLLGGASLLVTLVIVTQINLQLFGSQAEIGAHEIRLLSVMWLLANLLRMALVGSAVICLLKTYIRRQVRNYVF